MHTKIFGVKFMAVDMHLEVRYPSEGLPPGR